ncbi:MAG: KH domain-containing protein [Erysipelotrichaceae bacterium]|mgnify:CR=1 FL=1|nr:KH domain-containing protein [Erysipelotrichaceae bacterium]
MKNYTAKTLQELLEKAAAEKGVTVEELTYFVTEEKKGILGLGASVSADVYCLNDVKEFLFDYLGNFFTSLDQDIEIEIIQNEEEFKVKLNAENNAVLIGKNGQTLQAINTVVRSAVNSKFKHRFIVYVDVNEYKNSRYSKLRKMAFRIGKTVQRTKVDASLDPMPNDERKVIHQALTNMKNIKTESEGEGKNRHLVIKYVPNESAE